MSEEDLKFFNSQCAEVIESMISLIKHDFDFTQFKVFTTREEGIRCYLGSCQYKIERMLKVLNGEKE